MTAGPALAHDVQLSDERAVTRYSLIARAVALVCILTSPVWFWAMFFSATQDAYAPSLIFVPLMVVGCFVGFIPVWRGNRFLKQLLTTSLLARLAAASLYIWMGAFIYYGSVDAFHYWTVGMQRADDFSVIGWSAFPPPFWNTNLINNLCGFIMLGTGSTLPGLFVLFSLAALWGGYFFYRAFCVAFPSGDRALYGMLALLLPSNLFWSSAIGKDALAQLFIGLTAYGFARVCQRLDSRSILICGLGIGGMLAVRPHIAAMLGVAVTLPFALSKGNGGTKRLAAKIVLVPALILVSLWLISQAGEFVGLETADSDSGIQTVNRLTQSTQIGGSAFNSGQSLPVRVAEAPFMMFRPFPWEASGVTAAIASLEALALLWFAWKRRRKLTGAFRQWRQPFVAFILAYSLVFSVAFAATTSNFGILVRERIMMVPLLLMLFCTELDATNPHRLAVNRRVVFSDVRPAAIGR